MPPATMPAPLARISEKTVRLGILIGIVVTAARLSPPRGYRHFPPRWRSLSPHAGRNRKKGRSLPEDPPQEPGPRPVPVPSEKPVRAARRLPVAGAAGYFVVIAQDGSSQLERPDGTSTPLLEARSSSESPESPRPRIVECARAPEGWPAHQILDTGVVDVPRDAVITYTGRDYVVVNLGNGVSMVRHADGRTERRGPLVPMPSPEKSSP